MKGPGLRIDLDVRRLWQCPKCGRQVHCEGDVTSRACSCQKEETFMQLVGETKPATPRADRRESPHPKTDSIPRGDEVLPGENASESDFGSGIATAQPALQSETPERLPESGSGENLSG